MSANTPPENDISPQGSIPDMTVSFEFIALPDTEEWLRPGVQFPSNSPLSRALEPQSEQTATVAALLDNPDRHGPFVRRLVITDPPSFLLATPDPSTPSSPLLHFEDASAETLAHPGSTSDQNSQNSDRELDEVATFTPIPASKLFVVLSSCPNLEEFRWKSSLLPPDGICEVLSNRCPKLVSCTLAPVHHLLPQVDESPAPVLSIKSSHPSAVRWDAPSIVHLSSLPNLTFLHITRLTQSGARALASLFQASLSSGGLNLEDVALDFLWLDDSLIERLVESCGRRLRRIKLGTSGTKLTDKGIIALLEGADALEELALIEVQGRLSRTLWTKVTELPPLLATIQIAIGMSAHSWVSDHLTSLHSLALPTLTKLSVTRTVHPFDPSLDDSSEPKPLPDDLLEKLTIDMHPDSENPNMITCLEMDWWAWSPSDIKRLVESSPELEELKIMINAPFTKVFSLASAFANAFNLKKLRVTVPISHAPRIDSSQVLYDRGLPTPGSSPLVYASGSKKMQRADSSPSKPSTSLPSASSLHTPPRSPEDLYSPLLYLTPLSQIPPTTASFSSTSDPYLPSAKDIAKFARRCPSLEVLEWHGINGRGSWYISRDLPPPTSSNSASSHGTAIPISPVKGSGAGVNSVRVDYVPPTWGTPEERGQVSRERDALAFGVNLGRLGERVRDGQEWTGPGAEAYRARIKEAPEGGVDGLSLTNESAPPAASPTKSPSRRKPSTSSIPPLNLPPPASKSVQGRRASTNSPTVPILLTPKYSSARRTPSAAESSLASPISPSFPGAKNRRSSTNGKEAKKASYYKADVLLPGVTTSLSKSNETGNGTNGAAKNGRVHTSSSKPSDPNGTTRRAPRATTSSGSARRPSRVQA